MVEALSIRLSGRTVGILEYFSEDEDYVFSFDPEYLSDSTRPVLGQIFEDFRPSPITTSGMPCWFANLLPQHRLRYLIVAAAGIDTDDHFQLLRVIGEDLPGAVEVLPSTPRLRVLPREQQTRDRFSLELPPGLKFSLAGVQLKLSVRVGERGLTVPVRGETGRYIAKFDDPSYPDLPRVEHATLSWARSSGISVPEFRLTGFDEFSNLPAPIEPGNGSVFLIRRFDRTGDTLRDRVHMEDFAQILDMPPGDPQYFGSYEQIAGVLAVLTPTDLEEYVRRLVFSIICGNGDAHLKNWALIYPDGRKSRLSPAYDLVSTILYHARDKMALSLGGTKSFQEVAMEHFAELSKVARVDWALMQSWVTDSRTAILRSWERESKNFHYSESERHKVETHMSNVPLVHN